MGESKNKKPSEKQQETTKSSSTSSSKTANVGIVTYGPKQYRYVLIGLALLVIGFVLMSGGQMPSPDVWDESIIYGFRRTVAAPIFILAGLAMQIWAIFKV